MRPGPGSEHRRSPIIRQKRMADVVISSVVALLALPFSVAVVVLLSTEQLFRGYAPRPFYRERRMSQGVPFWLYKFNIFDPAALRRRAESGVFLHTKDLERAGELTRIGRVLQRIYLDELPQIFNVIRGEMTLVGPRPLNQAVYADVIRALGETAPQKLLRAGITGSFQSQKGVEGASAAALDRRYLEIYSSAPAREVLREDLRIIMRTIRVLIRAEGI